MFANKSGKQGFRDTKAIFCLLGKLPNPHRTLPAASGCASVPDASTAVPAKEKSPVQHEHYTHTAPDFPSSTTLSIFFFLLMQLLFFLLVPFQDFFATMSSDELKKDKQHQRKISFTALAFFYYIIVIKAPT